MVKENVILTGKVILVTGAAGFIGSNLVKQLYKETADITVIGIDNMNDYYDVELKKSRLKELEYFESFIFVQASIADKATLQEIFQRYTPHIVINLAAQAGVRYSITNPDAYIECNIIGFYNILEACRHSYDYGKNGIEHLVYASSSSVYGTNKRIPYSTEDKVDTPISLYAATKMCDELLAHAYSKLYNIPSTGLRFFTVYGPAGRPDMAYFSFTDNMKAGKDIQIFNYGNCKRDFTYIDDIVKGVENILCNPPVQNEKGLSYKLYNIGNNKPVKLMDYIETLERCLGREAEKEYLPMQPGDVYQTYADVEDLMRDYDFKPDTTIEEGLGKFVEWYRSYYKV